MFTISHCFDDYHVNNCRNKKYEKNTKFFCFAEMRIKKMKTTEKNCFKSSCCRFSIFYIFFSAGVQLCQLRLLWKVSCMPPKYVWQNVQDLCVCGLTFSEFWNFPSSLPCWRHPLLKQSNSIDICISLYDNFVDFPNV